MDRSLGQLYLPRIAWKNGMKHLEQLEKGVYCSCAETELVNVKECEMGGETGPS